MSIFKRKERESPSCLEENKMREVKREIKIGLFLVVALLILLVFIFIVGDLSHLFQKKGYPIYVKFDSVAGLEKRTVVRIAGVRVGYVYDIRLKGSQAEVELSIKPEVKIRKGARATLAALGLLGEKYIEILPGEEAEYAQPGGTIEGISAVSFDQIGSLLLSVGDEIKEIGKSVRGMIGEEGTQTNFKETFENLSVFVADLRGFFGESRQDLNQSIQRSSQAIQKFDQSVDDISQNLDELISLLKDTVVENKENVKGNLENIKELILKIEESLKLLNESLGKINKGNGTLGKLIHQPELYQRAEEVVGDLEKVIRPVSSFRAILGIKADYYSESDLLKGTLTLGLWPTTQKYVLGQIIHDPWLDRFTYSAQGGIRWGPVSPRAGIMESEVGAGIDYYALNDRLKFSLEGYNFNRNPRPHFRFWTRFAPSKYIYFLIGVEDFTLASNRELFFGLGFGYQ